MNGAQVPVKSVPKTVGLKVSFKSGLHWAPDISRFSRHFLLFFFLNNGVHCAADAGFISTVLEICNRIL